MKRVGPRRLSRRLRLWRGVGLCLVVGPVFLVGCDRRQQPPRSVIVIVVDTLRADRLGTYGYDRETSPELDRWAESALVFENAYATSPWTLPSMGSLLTGTWPSRHLAGAVERSEGERKFAPLSESVSTLPELLREQGMRTAAIVNNPFLHSRFRLDRGFDLYDQAGGGRQGVRRADVVVDRALEWIDSLDPQRPYFLLVHFFDPHLNYSPPEPYRGLFTDDPSVEIRDVELRQVRQAVRTGEVELVEFLSDAYDEEIAFVDREVGRLFEQLRARGEWDENLVIFTSDHGEEFLDHGRFEHGHSLYDEVLKVPLIVWGPGLGAGRVETPVSLADISPSVVVALGHGDAAVPNLWQAAEEELAERPLVAEYVLYGGERQAVLSWPWKLVIAVESGATELFDLSEDPGETQNLARRRRGVRGGLLDALASHNDGAAPDEGDALELDEATADQLRSLGYIE